MKQPKVVSLSAVPLALAGVFDLMLGGQSAGRDDAGIYIAFGLTALATAGGVVLRATWAFVLEAVLGIAILAWSSVVTLILVIVTLVDPHEAPAPTWGGIPLIVLLPLSIGAGGWMVAAAWIGFRSRHNRTPTVTSG